MSSVSKRDWKKVNKMIDKMNRTDYEKSQRGFKLSGILFGISVVVLAVLMLIIVPNEAALTIQLHYSGFSLLTRAMMFVGGALIGSAMVCFCVALYRRHKANVEQKQTAEAKAAAEQAAKQQIEQAKIRLNTPEGIAIYLEDLFRHETPDSPFSRQLLHLLRQLEKMNALQAKLETLLSMNGITRLDETKDLLQDIEDAICMTSTKRLINHYIGSGESKFLANFEKTAKDNEELLGEAQGVIDDIVEFINGGTTLDEVKQRIASFRETTQNFIKREESQNEGFQTQQSQANFGTGTVAGSGR